MQPRLKVLFVDDEPGVLLGLRRRLSLVAKDWGLCFAGSAAEALALLEREKMDVIVSDMRMPVMDGASLLAEVRQRYPGVARIVLSGHSDDETILRAVGPTHQYLSKPCDTEVLRWSVERTCALRNLLGDPGLQEAVAGLSVLPSIPELYRELIDHLRKPGASLSQVAAIVSTDMGMTAKILQLVNSEFFRFSRKVTSAGEAVNLLGLETIRSLVLTIGVFSASVGKSLLEERLAELWHHSILVGVCSRQIALAEAGGRDVSEECFTAGLLHDIGRLVLESSHPNSYQGVLETVRNERIPLWEAERKVLGAAHTEVGAYLLGLWGFSDAIVEAVAFHHTPGRCPVPKFVPLCAVHAADALLGRSQLSSSRIGADTMAELDSDYLSKLSVNDHVADWQVLCAVTLEEKLAKELNRLIVS